MRFCPWINIVCWRKGPTFRGKQKTMITEVVICVAKHYVECDSAIKFPEILPYIGTPTKNEIDDVKIAVTCAAARSIVKAGHGLLKS